MDKPIDRLATDVRRCAYFFDLDGTLAQIQPSPELVFIPAPAQEALQQLHAADVPVALVSGRPLEQIDALIAPLQLPAAGIHGAERRGADGQVRRLALDSRVFAEIQQELAQACAEHPGLRFENKGIAFALHFRQAPELEEMARTLAEAFAERYREVLVLQPGKCVFELKPRGASKGEVIRTFMQEAPFVGRVPVFVGDDRTDEAGFEVVNQLGGLSIKVGEGPTQATLRLASVDAVGAWLGRLLEGIGVRPEDNDKSDRSECAP
ncbi:trehalose-phosphatase [Pseudomonas saudiphocaensis]|uniref:trehalose-phosphatase n=1 Tax=Pseudomonas saudiphocaensis TaxID=1499686 RepID=UPI000F766C2E|nr:trehalose-phosphatase [Pseudomonas saudiphocaensis]RRV14646.1 trehalose-phosphatase [Pseudomonas saudiphocaensis]